MSQIVSNGVPQNPAVGFKSQTAAVAHLLRSLCKYCVNPSSAPCSRVCLLKNLQDTLLWASSQGEYSDSPWQSTRPPEASTWSDEASVTDLALAGSFIAFERGAYRGGYGDMLANPCSSSKDTRVGWVDGGRCTQSVCGVCSAELLTRLERAEDQLWSNVEKDDELVADLLKIPLRSFMTSQRQADAIERVLNGLKRKIAMFKWQYRELLELISSTAVGNAGVVRERLGKLRMRLSDTLRNVSLIALEEFGVFASRLKSKPKERVLVAREYGAEMALSMHRVETMAKKYKLLCDARTKVLERMQNWDKELTSQSVRMSERAMEEIRIQMDSYASAAGSAMSVKEAEFTRFVKTSRMEELYFQSIIEDCIHQLNTKGVAVIDVSKAWDPTNPGVLTAVGRISKIIEAISALNDSWSIYPAFVHVDEQDTKYPGGSSRLQLQPSVRTIQAAVEPLFQEPGLSQYCVISISQLLTRSVVASANVAGMAVSPISVFVSTEPAVVSSAKHFGFHFTRRLAHLGASDFSITSENQKVLIAYLGQTPLGEYKGNETHLGWLSQLGSAIVSFLSYDASGPYELLKLRSHVKSELAYVAAIERNTNTRLLSEALTDGYGALLADGVSDLGYVKLFERHNTAVFVGITRLPPLQLPLSSFLRAAAFIMRIEVARSKYGQREYVVPSRDTVLQALTHLFLYPVIGDAQALVRTKLWSDTRFPLLRVKSGCSQSYLVTSQKQILLGRDHIADLRGQHLHRDSMVATLTSYVSTDFIPQNIEAFREKLDGRILYVQVCIVGEQCG
ncbi:uncharacterized protein LOC34619850 [Cyclospora cayetanensis]|uniref:Uncharacterized protein LOC34619850 n=1 Tax=Cyclospora cayetanensis TaxID=88456 RepID=A0A6P6RW40_9EIME|nr:uncharacterized protein LOC34619850 [Cyclospora cayetanensis]